MEAKKKSKTELYERLGVSKTATPEEIKSAYKKSALKWHPDKHPEADREKAKETFQQISEAYSILSNEKQRAYYDKYGSVEGSEDFMESQSFMDDLMAQMFGGKGGMGFDLFGDDGFDEFISVIEGGSDKAFRSMFREMGKNSRISTKGVSARKAQLKSNKSKKGGAKMDMMDMMGMGMGMSMGVGKKGKNKGMDMGMGGIEMMMAAMMMDDMANDDGMEEEMAREFQAMPKRDQEDLLANMEPAERKEFLKFVKKCSDGWETDSDDAQDLKGIKVVTEEELAAEKAAGAGSDGDWETDSD